eukprot:CAMPEP_0194276542 /NCGR_PEP_ID=MMETSP0169-20130528/9110_1 /TAXON_ID=218684 /ORGANISM="Corethron pennatum, Strain L29A3" /LENGTH=333 /DNA_ID=CAMNT_0039020285 /DNA_START=151 /DNA_END=1152 /DNA_ORIENTATION=+
MGTGIIFTKSDVGGYYKGGDTSIRDSRTSNIIESSSSIYSELAGQSEHSPWCEPVSRSELVNILDFAGAQTVQILRMVNNEIVDIYENLSETHSRRGQTAQQRARAAQVSKNKRANAVHTRSNWIVGSWSIKDSSLFNDEYKTNNKIQMEISSLSQNSLANDESIASTKNKYTLKRINTDDSIQTSNCGDKASMIPAHSSISNAEKDATRTVLTGRINWMDTVFEDSTSSESAFDKESISQNDRISKVVKKKIWKTRGPKIKIPPPLQRLGAKSPIAWMVTRGRSAGGSGEKSISATKSTKRHGSISYVEERDDENCQGIGHLKHNCSNVSVE